MKRRTCRLILSLAALALAAGGALPVHAKRAPVRRETAPAVADAAPKWEYCVITGISVANRSPGFVSVAELCYFRGARCEAAQIEGASNEEALARAISSLGENGWEMVGESLFPPRGQDSRAIYFKRRKR